MGKPGSKVFKSFKKIGAKVLRAGAKVGAKMIDENRDAIAGEATDAIAGQIAPNANEQDKTVGKHLIGQGLREVSKRLREA